MGQHATDVLDPCRVSCGERDTALSKRLHRGALLVSIAATMWCLCAEVQGQKKAADTIVLHARIYTVNEKQPWAQALAIRDAKIVAVGSEKSVEEYRGTSTKIIDAKGNLILPGFEDCHIHFM